MCYQLVLFNFALETQSLTFAEFSLRFYKLGHISVYCTLNNVVPQVIQVELTLMEILTSEIYTLSWVTYLTSIYWISLIKISETPKMVEIYFSISQHSGEMDSHS